MRFIVLILFLFLVSCGGGSSTSSNSSSSVPAISGLQSDINAIEPVDLD